MKSSQAMPFLCVERRPSRPLPETGGAMRGSRWTRGLPLHAQKYHSVSGCGIYQGVDIPALRVRFRNNPGAGTV